MPDKTARDYRQLPYRRTAKPVENEGEGFYWLASVEEIPWIRVDGATYAEALVRLDEIFDDCVESMIEAGDAIPEPKLWPGELPKVSPGIVARNVKVKFDLPKDLPANTQLGVEKGRELLMA